MSTSSQARVTNLQLARYRFHWQIKTPLQLPPYASSTLRGVFGRALRQQACLIRASECRGCAMVSACPYPQLFEPQTVPRPPGGQPALSPYAIETSFTWADQAQAKDRLLQPGERYSFDMVLQTPAAIGQLPLIVAAWKRAFARGVGRGDGKAELKQVEYLAAEQPANTVYSSTSPQLQRHGTGLSVPQFTTPEDVQLRFQTPLRIEQQGWLVGERSMTASLFLRHLIRRVSFQVNAQQLGAFSLDDIHQFNALADRVQSEVRQLTWCDWERYSSRQKQRMKLGGLVGHWHLPAVPAELLPLIYLGQWLHVGKETAFGLGHYQWLNGPNRLPQACETIVLPD